MEHLQPEDKEKFRNNGNVLQNILGFGEREDEAHQENQVVVKILYVLITNFSKLFLLVLFSVQKIQKQKEMSLCTNTLPKDMTYKGEILAFSKTFRPKYENSK